MEETNKILRGILLILSEIVVQQKRMANILEKIADRLDPDYGK